ncbi:hypothetical protein [Photobacterium sp. 53610]|uniref:hypothetical protein n=1 Tax=Photobacterium sp. 53610 TaxID=3102789 RepID=UPI002ED9DDD2
MNSAQDFSIYDQSFRYKQDEYSLTRIRNARVKINTLKDHLLRIISIGLIVSSVVWVIFPDGFSYLIAPIGILFGAMGALVSGKKYELQIEFEHTDETGLQWISVAKGNKLAEKKVFLDQVHSIKQKVTSSI